MPFLVENMEQFFGDKSEKLKARAIKYCYHPPLQLNIKYHSTIQGLQSF